MINYPSYTKEDFDALEEKFKLLDSRIKIFSKKHKLSIQKQSHEYPDRVLYWHDKGIKKRLVISASVADISKFGISLMACKDIKNKRYACSLGLDVMSDFSRLDYYFDKFLFLGRRVLARIEFEDLIYESDLPKKPKLRDIFFNR